MLRSFLAASLAACVVSQTPYYQVITLFETISDSIWARPGSTYPYPTYHYFKYNHGGASCASSTPFRIRLSNLAPPLDVDMFVGDYSTTVPTSTSYTWASTNSFAEIIDITAPAGPTPGDPCVYYIAVSPFSPGNVPYSLQILYPNTSIPLTPGAASDGYSPPGGTTYFNATFPVPSSTLTAVLTANVFVGDVQVFVTAASGAQAPPTPSFATAAFTLNAYPGVNTLPLSFADPRVVLLCPVGSPCNLALGAFSPLGSSFSLELDTSNAAVLQDGVPLTRSSAANASAFFVYSPLSAATVNVTLTVFAGSPSLFVSNTPSPGPNSGAWQWSAVQGPAGGAGALFVSISPSDTAWPPPAAGGGPGPLYIGVASGASAFGPATFSISAVTATGGYAPFLLEDGVPQGATVPPHAMSYFLLDLAHSEGSAGGLDAWAVPSQGAVAVYVSAGASRAAPLVYPTPLCRAADPQGVCLGWTAAPGTFNWTSEGTSPPPGLVALLDGTMQQPTPNLPVVVVAVLAASLDDPTTGAPPPPSVFVVTAASGGRPMQLQAGVGVPGAVSAASQSGDTKLYVFYPSIVNAGVTISVEVPTGRLEVYAAEFSVGAPSLRPGPNRNQWNSTGQDTRAIRSRVVYVPWAALSPGCRFAVAAGSGSCGIAVAVVGALMMPPMRAAFTITVGATGSPAAPISLPNNGYESVLLQPPLGCAYLLSRAPLGAFQTAAFVTVTNVVGTTTLRVNVGEGRGGFWQPVNPNPNDPTGNAADYTAPDEGGYERVVASVNASQSVYSTVCADGSTGAEAIVGYHLAGAIVPLEGGVPVFGASVPGGTAYYSFAVTDPSATLTVTVSRLDTAMNVYIAVENPLQPWVLPSPTNWMWTLYPTPLGPSISIPPGAPACVPSPAAPSCTYYIAVQPIELLDATWIITATADPQAIPSLLDGQPTGGSVQEGIPNFYLYQPALAGFPAPPVLFSWSNLFGQVALYVTNRYVPGSSQPSDLPGPSSTSACQWICTNYTTCAVAPGDPCYAPTFPPGTASPVLYTVAVVGATGFAGATSTYTLTATNAGDVQQLQMGTPTTDIILAAQTSATFVIDLGLGSARNDVAITATVNHGDVYMLVAPLNYWGGPPGCFPFAPGARLYCANYTWLASSGIGDSVLYLPAANPCAPVTPAGTPAPLVDPSCAAAFPGALLPGRYLVTIFSLVLSELSLLAQDYARPVPKVLLADGQPQLLQSGPLTVCPGVQRNSAGACPGGAPAVATLGSLAVFYVPAGNAAPFVTVMVERLCGGNVTGECGTPLWVGVSACADGYTCANATAAPYGADAAFNVSSLDAVTSFTLTYDFCWNTAVSGALPPGGVNCFYTLGVWPTPPGGGGQPGVGVQPQTYRLTATTPLATQRVAQDCPGSGRFCSLPEQYMGLPGDSGAPAPPRRFESYLHKAPAAAAPLPATAVASLCYGTTLAVYGCALGGSCARNSAPGPTNYDFTSTFTAGTALLKMSLSSDVYWLGVAAGGGGRIPPPRFAPAAPSFSLSLQHGPGLTLAVPPGGALTPTWSADGATLTVSWPLPTLTVPGVPGNFPPIQGMVFVLHAYLLGSAADPAVDNQVQLSTPCGLEYVRRNIPLPPGQGVVQFAPQAQVCGSGGVCSIALSGLSTTISYRLALVGYCGPMADPPWAPGSPSCMPLNQEGQAVAFPWTSDVPAPVPPPPPPPPAPVPPSAPQKPDPAGAVVGTLFALAVVGALGWFGVERFHPGGRAAFFRAAYDLLPSSGGGGGGGGVDGFYGQLQQSVGLRSSERPSASAARGALTAHPILAAQADDAGLVSAPGGYVAPSADYAAL